MDVGFATDVPGVEKKTWGDVTLGGGPILQRNANNNPVLNRIMFDLAAKKKIPYQLECGHRASGAEVAVEPTGIYLTLPTGIAIIFR